MDNKASKSHSLEPKINIVWLPILIGALLFTLVLLFWWELREEDRKDMRNLVLEHTNQHSEDIQKDVRSRIPALQRIVQRWEFNNGSSEATFMNETQFYLRDLPGFQALEWVDKNFKIKWVNPLMGNEQALGVDLGFEKNRRMALQKAKINDSPTMSNTIDLIQGGKGFLVYFPIYIDMDFNGFFLAVFKIKPWLDHIFHTNSDLDISGEFKIKVNIDGTPVYEEPGWEKLQDNTFEATVSTTVLEHQITITTRPTAKFFAQNNSQNPTIAFLIGMVLTVLISFIIHLFQKTSTEAWRTYSTKQTLEIESKKHRETAEELSQTSARLTVAAKAGKIGIWCWDIKTNIFTWNDRMFELYDIPSDITPNYETWRNSLHPEDALETESKLKDAVDGKRTFDTEFRIINSDGEIKHVHAAAKVERDATNKSIRMTGVYWDVTAQKKIEEQIRHMATHDVLTGLPTLKLAKDRVGMALAIAQRKKLLTAIMFIDLDGFKNVNDTLGHDAGDAVLQETAKRLLSCVRKVDTVARIGGDEFLIVLNELNSKQDMETIAGKIVTSIAMPFIHKSNQITIGSSIGISIGTASCAQKDIEGLIKQADEAMYSIKKTGKNGYAFADSEYFKTKESSET